MAKQPRPRVIVAADRIEHLEGLAQGAMQRAPDMADRLLTELSRAKIVAREKLPADVIDIGRAVTYRDETIGKDHTVTLVWPEDADIDAGRVSVITPIGVALIGLQAGAKFVWETRNGETRDLTVLQVAPAPAAA